MRRVAGAVAAALALAGSAAAADPAAEPVFAVVSTAAVALPSADVPNEPNSLVLPPDFAVHASATQSLAYAELQALWQRAGEAYGIPWQVLAAINKIESNFGQNMGPSSAGAVGWMQFMPDTWLRWGMDASGDGVADPWNPEDGVYAAARYLAAAGGQTDLQRAVFAYNHAQWYVDDVLGLAQTYARGGLDVSFAPGTGSAEPDMVVAAVADELADARALEEQLAADETRLLARVARVALLSDRLAAEKQGVLAGVRHAEAASEVERLEGVLAEAERNAADVRRTSWSASLAPGGGALLAVPSAGDSVFPVAGGASLVSVAHDHHDYPAADIAAPEGSPVLVHGDAVITAAYPAPEGNCGIGATLRTGDGRSWTYCHLAYLEPGIVPGTVVAAGDPLGAVGMTGHTTGPHLHLQLNPAASYPQEEPWFQQFVGTAYRWQGEPAPSAPPLAAQDVHTVFSTADQVEPQAGSIVTFTR